MKYLNIKLRRDLLKNWMQFFSVFLMAFLSVLIYTGLEGSWHGMDQSVNNYLIKSNTARSWINGVEFSDKNIKDIKNIKSNVDISIKTKINVENRIKGRSIGQLSLETIGTEKLSTPILLKGNNIKKTLTKALWINIEYAESHSLKVGDKIEVIYNEEIVPLTIQGFIQSPTHIYYTGVPEFVAPNFNAYGYGVISEDTLLNHLKYKGGSNLLELSENSKKIREKIPEIMGNNYISYADRNTLIDISTAIDRVKQIRSLSVLFSFIFIILALLAMYTTIRRLVETQNKEIATLKALGYSERKIIWHYSSFGLFVGGLGSICGALIAPIMSTFVLATQKPLFSLPSWEISYTWTSILVFILVILICTLSAYTASRASGKGLPVQLLNENISKRRNIKFFNKLSFLLGKVNLETRWTLRDALSNPMRIFMGIIGVCGGMMLLMAGFGMADSMTNQVSESYGSDFTYNTRIKLKNISELIDGKDLGGQWLQTLPAKFDQSGGLERVLSIIGDGKYINVKTKDGKHVESGGIYITEGLAKTSNIKVGDTLEVSPSMDSKHYKFKVKGILLSSAPQGAYITQNSWIEAGGNFSPQTILVGNKNKIKSVKDKLNIDQIITIQEQKKVAKDFISNLSNIFLLIKFFAILLSVVILYNLGALNFVERRRDYATLRVLGYHKKEIRSLAMKENIIITLLGWGLGLPLGFWFLKEYVSTFSTYEMVYYPHITILSLVISSLIIVSCSLTTTFLLGRRIEKLDMIEALKGVE